MTQEQILEHSVENSMIMMIDTLAERYGMLPSEVIRKASTFDLFICDAAITYRNLIQERAQNNGNVSVDTLNQQYSQEELKEILNG